MPLVAHPKHDVESVIYELALMSDMKLMVEGFIGFATDFLKEYDDGGNLGLAPGIFNQDALENFFGCIRSRGRSNSNPTVQSYAHRRQKKGDGGKQPGVVRKYDATMGGHASRSSGVNTAAVATVDKRARPPAPVDLARILSFLTFVFIVCV